MNHEKLNNSLRMKLTVDYITAAISRNDLESAENWARHLEMQLSAFRLDLTEALTDQSKEGASK